jgi:predicted GIY-YIG superfamily endonuclease
MTKTDVTGEPWKPDPSRGMGIVSTRFEDHYDNCDWCVVLDPNRPDNHYYHEETIRMMEQRREVERASKQQVRLLDVCGVVHVAPPTMTTALYRPYDAEQRLLYVGITDDFAGRQAAHRRGSTWAEFACRVKVDWFPSRNAAEQAEIEAIKVEQPVFNDQHNATPEARERAVRYLVERGRVDLLALAVSRG